MAFPKNENREKFKKEFFLFIEKKNRGEFLKDSDIHEFTIRHEIKLSKAEVASLIRHMETLIGFNLKKRLKRLRNEGYLILESAYQAETAIREGKEKVKIALKKTSERLDAVDTNQLTSEQQRELLHRTMAVDSLISIINNSSMAKKVVNKREMELLNNTAIQSRFLKVDS